MSSPIPSDSSSVEFYSLEMVEQITRISRDRIVIYQQYGLITPISPGREEDLRYDEAAIHKLRRLALLLAEYELNEKGLRDFSALLDEVERLQDEVRFLRR